MKLEFPYPPKALSPNSRCHWGARHRASQGHKANCYLIAKQEVPKFTDKQIHLSITFHPKTANLPDADNLLASMKAGLDGIALAWNVNDSRFVPHVHIGKPVKNGSVVIEVME